MNRKETRRCCRGVISVILALVLALNGSVTTAVLAEEEILLEEVSTDNEMTDSTEEAVPDLVLMDETELSETEFLTESTEQEEANQAEAGTQTETVPSEELFVTEIEMVTDPGYISVMADEQSEEILTAEETETFFLEASGDASDAGISRFRAFSLESYTDSYGAQLEGNSRIAYQALEKTWWNGGNGTAADVVCDFSKNPYTFTTKGTIIPNGEGENDVSWDKNSEEYQETLFVLAYDIQSAFAAFNYDYPETFWLGHVTYTFGIRFQEKASEKGLLYGKISSVTVCGTGSTVNSNGEKVLRERYEGASGEINAFKAAVDVAESSIHSTLPEDADNWDKVKEIHEYICKTVSYGENDYAHTAAGVFHKEKKEVVCEGYAKAMKILCRRFGIDSVLIVGDALKSTGTREAHMWNYVRMEDGSWYLVDPTWDDQASGIQYTYFLAGSGSVGFNAVISTERQAYDQFTAGGNSKTFALPQLSENHYHLWQEEKVPASCETEGMIIRKCQREGCTEEYTTKFSALGHDWDDGIVTIAATCEEAGERTCKCQREGCMETYEVQIPALGHDWDSGIVTIAPTCEKAGEKILHCQREGCNATDLKSQAPLGHAFSTQWTVDRAATCTQEGKKSHHCTHENCNEREEVTSIPAGHKWDTGKTTKAATCTASGVRTYTCTVCGQTKREEISALNHSYGSWTVKKSATVLKAGTKIRTCSRCGASETSTIPKLKRTIQLNVTKLPIQVGKSASAVKVTKMTSGDYIKSWKSSNTKIASVSKEGVITGKKAGNAKITVTLASKATATVNVTVQKKKVETTALSVQGKTIVIKNKKLTLKKGKKETLVTKLTPLTSSDKVTYSVSNKKIVSVSSKGVVTARKKGTAKITVKSGKKKVVLTVTVK